MNRSKKRKSIENELMDDLLNEESSVGEFDFTNDVNHSNDKNTDFKTESVVPDDIVLDIEEDSCAEGRGFELTSVDTVEKKESVADVSDRSVGKIEDLLADSVVALSSDVVNGNEPDVNHLQPESSEDGLLVFSMDQDEIGNKDEEVPDHGDVDDGEDKTIVVSGPPPENVPLSKIERKILEQTVNKNGAKFNLGQITIPRSQGEAGFTSAEVSLSQSEALRIAQNRILELEIEIERLREENESLAAAGQAVSKRADELLSKFEQVESRKKNIEERYEEEKETLLAALSQKDRELKSIKQKEDEFEVRLSSNLKKVRVRERELENRLELVKLEGSALLRNKDEIILDMKRKLDLALHEINSYRSKGQELGQQLNENQDTLRKTVKALRIALSMLEGDLDAGSSEQEEAS